MTMTNAYRLAWQMHQFKADVDFSCLLGLKLGNFMSVQEEGAKCVLVEDLKAL